MIKQCAILLPDMKQVIMTNLLLLKQ